MSKSPVKHKLSLLPMLTVLLLCMPVQPASAADSAASVFLLNNSGLTASDSQSGTATPATATLGVVSGSARSNLGTGSVGVNMTMGPGSDFGSYSATASWNDGWTVEPLTVVESTAVPVFANITLDGSFDTSLLTFTESFIQARFTYRVDRDTGSDILSVLIFADSSSLGFQASFDGTDISSSLTTAPHSGNPLLTDFHFSYTPTVDVTTVGFTDSMSAQIRVDGLEPLTFDAFHTFHVDLTSLDPNFVLTDEGGRSAALAVPEPETYAMLLAGLSLLGFVARRRQRVAAAD